jgi:DNA-binding NtrC family response regulator
MEPVVLFVSPYVQDVWALTRMLGDVSVAVIHASSLKEAVAQMDSHRLLTVLTEATLEDGTWRDLLPLTRHKKIELVVTDAFADSRFWAEAINLGAYDVLAQPFHGTEVQRVLASASSRRVETRAAAGL